MRPAPAMRAPVPTRCSSTTTMAASVHLSNRSGLRAGRRPGSAEEGPVRSAVSGRPSARCRRAAATFRTSSGVASTTARHRCAGHLACGVEHGSETTHLGGSPPGSDAGLGAELGECRGSEQICARHHEDIVGRSSPPRRCVARRQHHAPLLAAPQITLRPPAAPISTSPFVGSVEDEDEQSRRRRFSQAQALSASPGELPHSPPRVSRQPGLLQDALRCLLRRPGRGRHDPQLGESVPRVPTILAVPTVRTRWTGRPLSVERGGPFLAQPGRAASAGVVVVPGAVRPATPSLGPGARQR